MEQKFFEEEASGNNLEEYSQELKNDIEDYIDTDSEDFYFINTRSLDVTANPKKTDNTYFAGIWIDEAYLKNNNQIEKEELYEEAIDIYSLSEQWENETKAVKTNIFAKIPFNENNTIDTEFTPIEQATSKIFAKIPYPINNQNNINNNIQDESLKEEKTSICTTLLPEKPSFWTRLKNSIFHGAKFEFSPYEKRIGEEFNNMMGWGRIKSFFSRKNNK